MTIHFSEQTILSFTHVESITLGAGEEVDEVAGGSNSIDVVREGYVGDRASEVQAAEV